MGRRLKQQEGGTPALIVSGEQELIASDCWELEGRQLGMVGSGGDGGEWREEFCKSCTDFKF